MASNEPTQQTNFTFAVRELRKATLAKALSATHGEALRLTNENRGVDPYNTSGSFDRKNNWSRVSKR